MPTAAVDIRSYAPEFYVVINGRRLTGEVSGSILSINVDQELNRMNDFTFQVQDECIEGGFRWLRKKPMIRNSLKVKSSFPVRLRH